MGASNVAAADQETKKVADEEGPGSKGDKLVPQRRDSGETFKSETVTMRDGVDEEEKSQMTSAVNPNGGP